MLELGDSETEALGLRLELGEIEALGEREADVLALGERLEL